MLPLKHIIFFVLAILMTPGGLPSRFWINMGLVVLDKTLWQEQQSATERQQSLALAASYFKATLDTTEMLLVESEFNDTYAMIPSIVAAEYYRRHDMYDSVATWLNRAASAPPYPSIQKAILLPGWAQLATNGAIVVDGASPRWAVRQDVVVKAVVQSHTDGIGYFSFSNTPTSNRAAFVWSWPLNVPYHHSVALKARVQPGCILRLETVIDGEIVRHFAQPGTGRWEIREFAVRGDSLRFIYILLDATADVGMDEECVAEVDYISFAPDQETIAGDE